ncbi:MAG: hypothetical protein ABMA01_21240 [Chthoniobacteraceae bacterium]
MKTPLIVSVLFAFAVTVPLLAAESPNERDFKLARAEREKALAVAAEPINRRYRDSLDKLFRRATQSAELDLAKAIQAELQVVGGTTAATAAGGAGIPQTTTAPAGATTGKADLKKLIEETTWVMVKKDGTATENTFIFRRDGTVTGAKHLGDFYTLEAPDILKTYPGRKKGPEFQAFRVNVTEKTAQQDVQLSTKGGTISLKYDGPAKAIKK